MLSDDDTVNEDGDCILNEMIPMRQCKDLRCMWCEGMPHLFCLYLAFTAGSEGPLGPGESSSELPGPPLGAAGERVHLSHSVF